MWNIISKIHLQVHTETEKVLVTQTAVEVAEDMAVAIAVAEDMAVVVAEDIAVAVAVAEDMVVEAAAAENIAVAVAEDTANVAVAVVVDCARCRRIIRILCNTLFTMFATSGEEKAKIHTIPKSTKNEVLIRTNH